MLGDEGVEGGDCLPLQAMKNKNAMIASRKRFFIRVEL
jgi:hypothetical protein